jgi:hypothetical protein
LYASPANMIRDLFCAFHPKRVIVPSFALAFALPGRPGPGGGVIELKGFCLA